MKILKAIEKTRADALVFFIKRLDMFTDKKRFTKFLLQIF